MSSCGLKSDSKPGRKRRNDKPSNEQFGCFMYHSHQSSRCGSNSSIVMRFMRCESTRFAPARSFARLPVAMIVQPGFSFCPWISRSCSRLARIFWIEFSACGSSSISRMPLSSQADPSIGKSSAGTMNLTLSRFAETTGKPISSGCLSGAWMHLNPMFRSSAICLTIWVLPRPGDPTM